MAHYKAKRLTVPSHRARNNSSSIEVFLTGEQVEDWDFAGSDTQFATHGMHTWLAAMVPPEAKRLIEVTEPKRVLDPFAGGGTVLVECALARIPARGVEINPLGVIVSRAKSTHIPAATLHQTLADIMARAKNGNGTADKLPLAHDVEYWFKPSTLKPLKKLSAAVQHVENEEVRTFFECVFSATARDVSLTHRNEIRLRRLEGDQLERFDPDVSATFAYRALDAITRLQKIPSADIQVIQGTALNMPFEDGEFTTVITSPPYGDERNGVPYFQFAKNMLYLLGWTREELAELKGQTLGWLNHNKRSFEVPPSPTLRKLVDSVKGDRTRKEAVAFYADYYAALGEMKRVTSERIAIVIGQRVLESKVFDNGRITTELLGELGVRLEKSFQRHLPSKRLPKMRDFGAAIDTESILIYKISH